MDKDVKARPPQVDKILREPILAEILSTFRRDIVRKVLHDLLNKTRIDGPFDAASLARMLKEEFTELTGAGIQPVINGTGVILSTNLGRAPLPARATESLYQAIKGYSNLEFDLEEGSRGERTSQIARLLRLITGAESAIVVNNCASAVMLAVHALANKKEVITSRGELIEIGGSFRLPDVIAASGGTLKEVGTTNRTRAKDYKDALTANTGILLKCHRSNFEISGFTEEAGVEQLKDIAQQAAVPLVFDLGGGCFVDLSAYDLKVEPTVQDTISNGADLVLFSGDKLLGGPQAGIICGRAEYVSKLRKCPIYRALRADKIVIAMLEAVLGQYIYVDGAEGPDSLPVFKFAARKAAELQDRANKLIDCLALKNLAIEVVPLKSALGGGSLPGELQDSFGIALAPKLSKVDCSEKIAEFLRNQKPALISTISKGRVIIDLRAVFEDQDAIIRTSLTALDDYL
ncbi:MAG: L-seryl-tRNA(Sec) selenium transferase [Candidatus Obscuribacter sp.]|nr:L-seryl-tRNA(Sec) selenium transferase [Candidatus Obscuribacter sp.]MBK9770048.1 L-seryl-tRNA(Sec) selenium transferase [Candidatus Obscuribacter sp.]